MSQAAVWELKGSHRYSAPAATVRMKRSWGRTVFLQQILQEMFNCTRDMRNRDSRILRVPDWNSSRTVQYFSHRIQTSWYPGADLENWGPQANIGMGPNTFAHNLEDSFFLLWCLLLHNGAPYLRHVVMGFFHLHLLLFIWQTLLFFHEVDHEIEFDLLLRYKFEQKN